MHAEAGPSARKIFHIDIGQGEDDTAVGMLSMSRTHWIFLLAVATLSVGAVNVYAGQFKRVTYYGVGYRQQPYHVVASHLTNSGNVDLAVGDYLSDRVSILLGNGDGTFQKALTFPVPAPIGIAVGDFNEDGIQDLAVVETGGTADGAIAIFLGDGKGHFKLSASYALGVGSDQVAVADLNGDGHLDVAVTNFGFGGAQGSVMTFLRRRPRQAERPQDLPAERRT